MTNMLSENKTHEWSKQMKRQLLYRTQFSNKVTMLQYSPKGTSVYKQRFFKYALHSCIVETLSVNQCKPVGQSYNRLKCVQTYVKTFSGNGDRRCGHYILLTYSAKVCKVVIGKEINLKLDSKFVFLIRLLRIEN